MILVSSLSPGEINSGDFFGCKTFLFVPIKDTRYEKNSEKMLLVFKDFFAYQRQIFLVGTTKTSMAVRVQLANQ